MSAALIEAPERGRDRSRVNPSRPGRRLSRGAARSGRPVLRDVTGVAPPRVRRPTAPTMPRGVRSCRAERAQRVRVSAAVESGWRLTERGIAVVLIAGAVLVASAVTVITATALTVTSEDYRPAGSSLHATR